MTEILDHPAFQGGVVPLLAALIVGFALARTRFAWLGIVAGYATMVALSTGFSLSPPTVARKTVLLGLVAPFAGLTIDLLPQRLRAIAPAVVIAAAALSVWVFQSILAQRDAIGAAAVGGGVALFVAALVSLTLRTRNDGLRAGAAGLGLGLATGIAGVLSASIGYLISGVAIAAAAGALLLVQVILSRKLAPGFAGTLPIGLLAALFATGALLLAELPWYALPLLLAVPIAALLPAPERSATIIRAAVLAAYALIAAALPILAAWYAARGSLS